MNLVSVIFLCGISLLIGLINKWVYSKYILLTVSVFALFALQPNLPIRYLDFWLSFGTLVIVLLSWVIIRDKEQFKLVNSLPAIAVMVSVVLVIGLKRYWGPLFDLIPSQEPQLFLILSCVVITVFCYVLLSKVRMTISYLWMALILLIFLAIKIPFFSYQTSFLLRALNGQSVELANSLDIRWLGFSYISFRIIHTIRDRQTGRLPGLSLVDYINYIIFFPTLTAGPIDRLEYFVKKIGSPILDRWEVFGEGSKRILLGLFKKFILADSLAIIALNGTSALQIRSTGWMWISLYAFAFQIFYDFSGYTDIAIGMGRYMGIILPENFFSPYLKPNITLFWNNWHITLTQWFRAYIFNPLTRALRSRYKFITTAIVIMITQFTTMLMIGLWHGATINYVIWGLWHGFGLFLHNRWVYIMSAHVQKWTTTPIKKRVFECLGVVATFNFVSIGWIFFVSPSPDVSWHILLKLIGRL